MNIDKLLSDRSEIPTEFFGDFEVREEPSNWGTNYMYMVVGVVFCVDTYNSPLFE